MLDGIVLFLRKGNIMMILDRTAHHSEMQDIWKSSVVSIIGHFYGFQCVQGKAIGVHAETEHIWTYRRLVDNMDDAATRQNKYSLC